MLAEFHVLLKVAVFFCFNSTMSVIFGLFYRDGKPVSDELETIYSGMKHFPQEKHSVVVQDNCGFGHILTYNTPEAVNGSMLVYCEL